MIFIHFSSFSFPLQIFVLFYSVWSSGSHIKTVLLDLLQFSALLRYVSLVFFLYMFLLFFCSVRVLKCHVWKRGENVIVATWEVKMCISIMFAMAKKETSSYVAEMQTKKKILHWNRTSRSSNSNSRIERRMIIIIK